MIALLLALLCSLPAPQSVMLTVTTSSAEDAPVRLAVYTSQEDFTSGRSLTTLVEPMTTGELNLSLVLPTAGRYVFAAFQDLNNNGELDTNMLGVPTEPYGFSKVPPTKWRAPVFGEIATEISSTDQSRASIELKHWKDY